MTASEASGICGAARGAILRRDFAHWRGLPPACGAAELFGAVPDDRAGRPVRELGDDFVPAVFVLLNIAGYYRPMASFRDGRLILFDAMNPQTADALGPLLESLGAPAARLDWEYGTLAIAGGEWPFPARGLTLFLNKAADRLLHVALYGATTLAEYQARLRPHLGKRSVDRR